MTTALTSPSTIDTAAADLVLVRMALPSKNPIPPSAVRKDVGDLLGSELSSDKFDELRNELASAGLLTKGKRNTFTLSEAGRDRALRLLGVDELPSQANWSTVIAKYLFPKAAGLTGDAAAALDSGEKLAAFVLKRKHGLAPAAGSTVNQVLEAVACKQLGFAQETTLEGLLCAVLSRLMRTERLTKEELAKQFPLFETGVTAAGADAARSAVVRDWLGSAPLPPRPAPDHERPRAEPFDLTAFAATVRALAADSPPQDRFQHDKVFIAALWWATQREPNFPRLSLPEFKQRLAEATAQNLLRLASAEAVGEMDPESVADSETVSSNMAFHFVLLEGDRP
jgi:hypothetical protein